MPNITNIPAPRVPFIEERTGLISREWYRFLLNLFTLVGGGQVDTTLADLLVAPTSSAAQESQLAELEKQLSTLGIDPAAQIAELQKQLDTPVGGYEQQLAEILKRLEDTQNLYLGQVALTAELTKRIQALELQPSCATAGFHGTVTSPASITVVNGLVTAMT